MSSSSHLPAIAGSPAAMAILLRPLRTPLWASYAGVSSRWRRSAWLGPSGEARRGPVPEGRQLAREPIAGWRQARLVPQRDDREQQREDVEPEDRHREQDADGDRPVAIGAGPPDDDRDRHWQADRERDRDVVAIDRMRPDDAADEEVEPALPRPGREQRGDGCDR